MLCYFYSYIAKVIKTFLTSVCLANTKFAKNDIAERKRASLVSLFHVFFFQTAQNLCIMKQNYNLCYQFTHMYSDWWMYTK